MTQVLGQDILFKLLWHMHTKRATMRIPGNPFFVFLVHKHMVNLFRKVHLVDFTWKLIIFCRYVWKVSVRVVDVSSRFLDYLNYLWLNRKGLKIFTSSYSFLRSLPRSRKRVLGELSSVGFDDFHSSFRRLIFRYMRGFSVQLSQRVCSFLVFRIVEVARGSLCHRCQIFQEKGWRWILCFSPKCFLKEQEIWSDCWIRKR